MALNQLLYPNAYALNCSTINCSGLTSGEVEVPSIVFGNKLFMANAYVWRAQFADNGNTSNIAASILTTATDLNHNFNLPLIDLDTTGYQDLYVDDAGGLTYNPNTQVLMVPTIRTHTIELGNTDLVSLNTSPWTLSIKTPGNDYLVYDKAEMSLEIQNATSGSGFVLTDTGTGQATWQAAGGGGAATEILTTAVHNNALYFPVLAPTNSTGDQAVYVDNRVTGPLQYDPGTGTLGTSQTQVINYLIVGPQNGSESYIQPGSNGSANAINLAPPNNTNLVYDVAEQSLEIQNATSGSGFALIDTGVGTCSWQAMSGGIQNVSVTINASKLATISTIPITVVASPGSGKLLQLVSYYFVWTYSTSAYTGSTQIGLVYTVSGAAVNSSIIPSGVLTGSINQYAGGGTDGTTYQDTTDVSNSGWSLSSSGNYTGGAGTGVLYVSYYVQPV